jgi:catechol 2,3-dioxygenase-like lactoylglutathione lyase family enzyme
MQMRTRYLIGAMVAVALTASAMPAAHANDGDVIRRGSCSGASDWKLKLSPEDGGVEVEFEVDQNRSGDRWTVRVAEDGRRIFAGSRVTKPPSGSFEVRLGAVNAPGSDAFRATATNQRTGETCVGRASS